MTKSTHMMSFASPAAADLPAVSVKLLPAAAAAAAAAGTASKSPSSAMMVRYLGFFFLPA
jgi:hypothetical protein